MALRYINATDRSVARYISDRRGGVNGPRCGQRISQAFSAIFYELTPLTLRGRLVRPEFPHLGARICFDTDLAVEDHGGPPRGIVGRPGGRAGIVRIGGFSERDPGRCKAPPQRALYSRTGSTDAVTVIVEGGGDVRAVD